LKPFKLYDIDILALKEKTHRYEYKMDDLFFQLFEGGLIERGNCNVILDLEKSSGVLTLNFSITGTLELTCDRTLEPFPEPIHLQERVFYKFGEEEKELADDVMVIPHGTATINIAHHIYDFISLSVPMKKLHPRFRSNEDEAEETLLIYSSTSEEESEEVEEDEPIDERWQILKEKFKHLE
jgi:uncharacterized metal-binding protein YceD (DUF177 family)